MADSTMFTGEHPFAQYVRTLGKGKTGSRNLTREESREAMRQILAGEVEPVQLGAFLMLMRHQEESGAELAGFVDASQDLIQLPEGFPAVDLDWSSYAGKARRLPWFILATWLMANNGVRVLMHGAGGHTPGRVYAEETLLTLGLPIAGDLMEAGKQIEARNFAFLPLRNLLPKLAEILDLKPLLGLRSPVNTFTRLLNPARAACSMQGIHHPGYREYHQEAALLMGQPRMAVIKGDGGETEWNPDMANLTRGVTSGQDWEEEWPALFSKKHVNSGDLDPATLLKVWRGEMEDEYGVGAIIGTVAISLKTLGQAPTQQEAIAQARAMWEGRDKGNLPAA